MGEDQVVVTAGGGGCHHICAFFGSFGFFVQFILAILSFSALICKRYQEVPRRPLAVFQLDALKNGLGAALAHFLNIFIAIKLAGATDPCPWYVIQIVLDTTIVVYMNFVMLRWLEKHILAIWGLNIRSGDYGEPPETERFLQQLGVWFVVVIVCKTISALLVVSVQSQLQVLADGLLSPLCFDPHLELFIVMVLLPLCLNAFSFWVMDNYLMYQTDMRPFYSKVGTGGDTALTDAFGGREYGTL